MKQEDVTYHNVLININKLIVELMLDKNIKNVGLRLETIVGVNLSSFPYGIKLQEYPWEEIYEEIKRRYTREMLAIVMDDSIVGLICLEVRESKVEIVFFEITEEVRGKGVGRAALDLLIENLKSKGYRWLFIQTTRPKIYNNMGYRFETIDNGHILIDLYEPKQAPVYKENCDTCFIYSDKYLIHDYPYFPENGGRVAWTINRLEKEGLIKDANLIFPRAATREEISNVHDEELIDKVRECSKLKKPLTKDTACGKQSYELALLSFGGALMAGELIKEYRKIFVLNRPPGHHAGRNKTGGFCFFNNMAGLALSLWKRGYSPMIIDWDVHHGNGTQEILYYLPIMYVSFHQRYLYPNTGDEKEIGEGPGYGYTRNFPLPIRCGDREYIKSFVEVIRIAKEVKPDIILISAGQDGHKLDPMSGMQLSSEAYYEMGKIVGEIAEKFCSGRLILLLEGGYHLEANAEALAMAIKGIRGF